MLRAAPSHRHAAVTFGGSSAGCDPEQGPSLPERWLNGTLILRSTLAHRRAYPERNTGEATMAAKTKAARSTAAKKAAKTRDYRRRAKKAWQTRRRRERARRAKG
jgi:hypothetical protein